MSSLTIYRDNAVDCTVIPNRFIDELMPDANDAQIKIYLYLLRTVSAHKSTSISAIADIFNYTEKDVARALRYWEKKHVLSLEYDKETGKNLCGIHFLNDLPSEERAPAEIIRLQERNVQERSSTEDNASEYKEKPVYSLDKLRAFQNEDGTRQLMFVAESYIGRPLSNTDMRTILYLSDGLHFSNDLIDYLIQYCVERGKKDFRYIEKVGISWAEQKITTPKEAARYSSRYEKNVYSVMKALGKNDTPTEKEVSYIRKWTGDYAFDMDIITEACERTVLATDRHRFEYADGILKNWLKNNVRHKADIQALDESHRYVSNTSNEKNKFNQFRQNAYDFTELEKDILSN